MKKYIKKLIAIMLFFTLLTSCTLLTGDYEITNVRIFMGTPTWELAKAVNDQDIVKIKRIATRTPEVLDLQDPIHGMTILFWAVGMKKYEAAEALLKAGADPNIISSYEGGTALYMAAGYLFTDRQLIELEDPKFVKLLLKYDADPNIGYVGNERNNIPEIGTTTVMNSIPCGIEKTKALVEAGADINFRTDRGDSAVLQSLDAGIIGYLNGSPDYAHYLIVEKKADVTKPWLGRASGEEVPLVNYLREWVYPLDSEGYKIKMEIVEEFARQGEDYWSTEIPKDRLSQIQKLYPYTWEEYILRY